MTDIQRYICENHSCPSALAIPPLWPRVWQTPAATAERLRAGRGESRPAFRLAGYRLREGVLYAAATSAPEEEAGVPLHGSGGPQGFFLPPFSGFYLADMGCGCPPEDLPPLPSYTVHTLRFLVMEITTEGGTSKAHPWWEAVSWRVISEDWIKLTKTR